MKSSRAWGVASNLDRKVANAGLQTSDHQICIVCKTEYLLDSEQEDLTCTGIRPLAGSLMLRNTSQQAVARSWSSAGMLGGRLGLISRGGSFLNEMMGSGILSSLVTVVPRLPFSSSSSRDMSQEKSAMPSPRPVPGPAKVCASEVTPWVPCAAMLHTGATRSFCPCSSLSPGCCAQPSVAERCECEKDVVTGALDCDGSCAASGHVGLYGVDQSCPKGSPIGKISTMLMNSGPDFSESAGVYTSASAYRLVKLRVVQHRTRVTRQLTT